MTPAPVRIQRSRAMNFLIVALVTVLTWAALSAAEVIGHVRGYESGREEGHDAAIQTMADLIAICRGYETLPDCQKYLSGKPLLWRQRHD